MSKPSAPKAAHGRIRRLLADRQSVLATLSVFTSAAMTLVVIAALVVGHTPLQARAAILRTSPARVRFSWPPLAAQGGQSAGEQSTWLDSGSRAALERLALAKLTDDPFDSVSLRDAREALFKTGWFGSDLTLRRGADNVVTVSGSWRVPVAAVRCKGFDRMVTRDGELLPLKYEPDRSGFRVILNPQLDMPEFGQPWLGGDVQAALTLLDYLRTMPGYEQVYGVDIADFLTKKQLVVVTDAHNRIIWGGPVNAFNPGQAPAQTKRERLAAVNAEYGRIDSGRPLIDLRNESGVYVQDASFVPPQPAPKTPPVRKPKR